IEVDVKRDTDFMDLSLGMQHACAIKNGGVKCWGKGLGGALGDGNGTDSINPAQVYAEFSGARSLALGDQFSCARFASGGVSCWGKNDSGQLGDGSTLDKLSPVPILSSDVHAITAGERHACAIIGSNRRVKCWGSNIDGQLGDGT